MKYRPFPTNAFTSKASGLARELSNEIGVSEVYDPRSGLPQPPTKRYKAVWDTGATNTVIGRRVVKELNLQASGRVTSQAVGQGDQINEFESDTYLVNIYLPNNFNLVGVRVAESAIAGADVLIGMDIITNGDFSITNYDRKTWWTFRAPSNESIDFVEEINEFNRKHKPPSAPLNQDAARRLRNQQKKARRKASGK